MAIGPQFKPKFRRRSAPAIVQNVHVRSQPASKLFKPLVFLCIGGDAPQRTRPQRTAELTAREARLLARELLARADDIDDQSK